ncbi:MAG: tRNA(Ile)-lysidine synthetase [Oscillospiraceae bacterium]|jgi:tRNA(Ile)-lysidine synthase|nr:tRNA(Ile)-lysidine synthetase [Oscillospiraceae bacterium]
MNLNAAETISNFNMLQTGDSVVVGVSGGADSMALLHFLKFGEHDLSSHVIACHINHCLRGEESDRDEAFVKNQCGKWNVPCYVLRCDVASLAKEQKLGVEECARNVRYDFFEKTAQEYKAKIATAHTQSDRTETMLFNLARGSALSGLCSIPPVRGNIIRPLIRCTRFEIEEYCKDNDIAFVTDSTNLETDYARNKIRLDIIPKFREINGGFDHNTAKLIENINIDNDYLEKQAEIALEQSKTPDGFLCDSLDKLHPAIKRRAAAQMLKQQQIQIDLKKIEGILSMIESKSGKINLSRNLFIAVKDGWLKFLDEEKTPNFPYFEIPVKKQLDQQDIILSDEKKIIIQIMDKENFYNSKKIYKNFFHYVLDYDKIIGNVVVRQWIHGDKIALSKRKVSKSLKKLFCEEKLDGKQKSEIAVLADELGVIAVERFGISSRAEASDDTKTYFCFDSRPIKD